ncbi:unnamed protein product [Sphagnum jensenii]|uniref:Uncharacterized protein n=1 Tax=Sphagnum jensenii TaxID=128206 RepID=A0ABP1BM54_9BRYO
MPCSMRSLKLVKSLNKQLKPDSEGSGENCLCPITYFKAAVVVIPLKWLSEDGGTHAYASHFTLSLSRTLELFWGVCSSFHPGLLYSWQSETQVDLQLKILFSIKLFLSV